MLEIVFQRKYILDRFHCHEETKVIPKIVLIDLCLPKYSSVKSHSPTSVYPEFIPVMVPKQMFPS